MHISKEKHDLKGYMHLNVHCSTVYNSQDMIATEMSINEEWIKKMWYIYTMEYYLAIKKNEIMPFATTWMDLETVILSEVIFHCIYTRGLPGAQLIKNPPAMQEAWVRSLGWEDPLEKGKATHSSILAWRIPWTE